MVNRIASTGMTDADRALGLTAADWDKPAFLIRGQTTMALRMPSMELAPGSACLPLPAGTPIDLAGLNLHDPLLNRPMATDDFLNRRLFNDGLLVLHRGAVRHESYRNGMIASDRHVVHSVTKTLTTMMVGIAVGEGRLRTDAPIADYVPQLAALPACHGVTLQNVLDMAAGIACDENYDEPDSMYWRYARAVGYYDDTPVPGRNGCLAFLLENLTERACEPGTVFNYASYLTNLLPLALQQVYGKPALELYEQRLFGRIGAQWPCIFNVDATGLPIVEGQANLTLRDLARWASLYVNEGRNLAGEQIVPAAWVRATIAPDAGRRAAFERSDVAAMFPGAQYRNKTWVLDAQRRRFAMLGIHGQFAYFDLERELMIVGMASYPEQVSPLMWACLNRLWDGISATVV